jgi:hypothetical protein
MGKQIVNVVTNLHFEYGPTMLFVQAWSSIGIQVVVRLSLSNKIKLMTVHLLQGLYPTMIILLTELKKSQWDSESESSDSTLPVFTSVYEE